MLRLSLAAVLTLFVIVVPAWSTPMDAASESPFLFSFEKSSLLGSVALDPPADEERSPASVLSYSSSPSTFFGEHNEASPEAAEIYAFREAALANMLDGHDDLRHEDVHVVIEADTEIPMVVNSRVERHIRFLLRRSGHVRTLLRRADTYFPMIERILREEGAPDELKYLAMVESALKPTARSWAGAAGMWQFIPRTGGAYGLTVNREVDWRLDPERATRAAARHLLDLHERFDDWHLAMAGYNMNPERVERYAREFERRNGRKATYWDIYHRLPRETQGFVPMFIATALVISDPEAYGFEPPRQGPAWRFDRIPVEGGTRFSEVARIVGTRESVIEELNPAFRRGHVPSGHLSEMIRIPAGTYARYARQLDRLAPSRNVRGHVAESVSFPVRAFHPIAPDNASGTEYASRSVARRPARELLARMRGEQRRDASEQSRSRTWGGPPQSPSERPARELLARVDGNSRGNDDRTTRPQTPSDHPSRELVAQLHEEEGYTPPARERTVPRAPQSPDERPARALVAELRGVSVEDLIEAETAEEASEEGDESVREQPRSGREALPVQLVADEREEEDAELAAPVTHVVQRGEWLIQIGREYNVTARQIMAWNDLRSETVHPGQSLTIHTDLDAAAPVEHEPETIVYTVKRGDNLTQISRRYDCSVGDLRRWNDLSRDRIVPGQRLTIHRESRESGVVG